MRLFLAIYPPKEFLDYFRDTIRILDKQKRNLRFVKPEQIHITVKFIGSKVNQASKNVIAEELKRHAGSYPKPSITLESVSLGFPRQRNPRIVLANIEPNYELDQLVDVLHRQIRSLKRRDTIQWKQRKEAEHHLTLARLKPAATKSAEKSVQSLLNKVNTPLPEPFSPKEFHLVASTLTPRGPVYQRLERIVL